MPTETPLTPRQYDCAAYLAAGATQLDTAQRVGISRATVSRWLRLPAFKAEVERRKERLVMARDVGDRTETEFDNRLMAIAHQQEIDAIRASKKQFRETELLLSQKLYRKAIRRLIDLPDEAITPNLIPALLQTAILLKNDAFQGWADELGLDAIADLLGSQG